MITQQLKELMEVINTCAHPVWWVAPQGKAYNLQSTFVRSMALDVMAAQPGSIPELHCTDRADTMKIRSFFQSCRGLR